MFLSEHRLQRQRIHLVVNRVKNIAQSAIATAAVAVAALAFQTTDAAAQQRTVVGERYVPTIWVDPTGCDHWIIDDGIEGYLSARLDPDGKPVCSGVAPPNTAIGPFKGADDVSDPL